MNKTRTKRTKENNGDTMQPEYDFQRLSVVLRPSGMQRAPMLWLSP